jgi:RNA polymerase sigma-70 factor, ECF subfamily
MTTSITNTRIALMPASQQKNISDEELFSLLCNSEDKGEHFAKLYERYSKKIYLYCVKIMDSKTDADDMFQETWIQIHKAAEKERTIISNVAGYIFRIARNCCLAKKRKAEQETISYEDIYPDLQTLGNNERDIEQILDMALSTLDTPNRDAFIMHELEGFSYEEIADVTGESVDALRNRVWRARKMVREYITPLLLPSIIGIFSFLSDSLEKLS